MPTKKSPEVIPATPATEPSIHEATLGPNGAVIRGNIITQQQAEVRRASGQDVVVCGSNLAANRAFR